NNAAEPAAKPVPGEEGGTQKKKTPQPPPVPGGSALVKSGESLGSSLVTTDKNSGTARSSTPPDVTQGNTPPEKGVTAPAGSNERSGSIFPDLSGLKSLVRKIPAWLRSGTSGTAPEAGRPTPQLRTTR